MGQPGKRNPAEEGGAMEEMDKTTISRLVEWLEQHGHDNTDIVDCIKFITKSGK